MQSLQLHRHLTQQFAEIGLKATPNERKNLAFLCQTLAFSPNCHLATLALGLPLPGRRENLIQHLRRTLKNQQLRSADCYQPLVRYLFAHWPDEEVNLVMDRTDLEHAWSLLTLGVAHQKRLLPLAWDLLPFGGTSADEQTALLKRVQPDLPPTTQVRLTFYGDCEFRAVPVPQLRLALASGPQVRPVVSVARGRVATAEGVGPAPRATALPDRRGLNPRAPIRAGECDRRLGSGARDGPLVGFGLARRWTRLAAGAQTLLDRTDLPRLEELWLRLGAKPTHGPASAGGLALGYERDDRLVDSCRRSVGADRAGLRTGGQSADGLQRVSLGPGLSATLSHPRARRPSRIHADPLTDPAAVLRRGVRLRVGGGNRPFLRKEGSHRSTA